MTPEQRYLNAMTIDEFMNYVKTSDHEEYWKDLRRIFADSLGLARYKALEEAAKVLDECGMKNCLCHADTIRSLRSREAQSKVNP